MRANRAGVRKLDILISNVAYQDRIPALEKVTD